VINLVMGDPARISDACLDHEDLGGIHFTGSTEVFSGMWRRVGNNISRYRAYPRLVGETGGKDFVFAHESADALALRTALVAEFSGDAWYNAGQFSRAAEAYKTASHRAPSDPLLESKLGLALVRSGRIGEGLRLQRGAIRRSGGRAEVHDRLILSLVWLERIAEASDAAQAKLGQVSHPTPSDFLRAAALAAKAHGNKNGAVELLSRGVEAHPEDKNLFMALQELLGSENDAMPVVSVSPHKPFT